MPAHQLRVVIVGASSLLGKELSEEIIGSALGTAEVLLFDTEAVEGQITTIGDEASFIRRVSANSFEAADFVFFAGSQDQAREHWQSARQAGAMVVDLTYALSDQPEVMVWSPWVAPLNPAANSRTGVAARRPDLQTAAVVPAHPIATMLGSRGLDELHQQTVNLLSFKDIPQEVFDAQTAFNVLADLGEDAPLRLPQIADTITTHFLALSNSELPELALQLLQVPVFHGYTSSIFLEFDQPVSSPAIAKALAGGRIEVATGADLPSNLLVAGRSEIVVSVSPSDPATEATRFWLCGAADNLKIAAANAIDCALGMRSLRPQRKVQ